ncbi:MAG TPA: ECF-type sigma factor [Urbifossiella sp.]|nr:ECF-type sigma factor [Urbifossiella sp.]
MSDVSRLIEAAAAGDRLAAADLLPLVYDELRQLASARLAAEPAGHTLQPTALVHEAYLRLIGPADAPRWDHRGHFFAAAAEAMRRILVDFARRRQAEKRGGADRTRHPLDPNRFPAPAADPDRWLALDEALAAFAREDPDAAELAKLRLCAGLSVEEASAALGVSPSTGFRSWAFARAWLAAALSDPPEEES